MEKDTSRLLNVQKAALFLAVSPVTIRQWAQSGKLKGVKVGSRGDWRFTKEELSKMIHIQKEKFSKIKSFLRMNAADIQKLSAKKHKEHLGEENIRPSVITKQKESHILIVKEFAKYIENVTQGTIFFEKVGEKLGKDAVEKGLTLEEAVDGTIFLKQAFWEKLNQTGLLYELTIQELYSFSNTITTYSDIVAAKIAFAYNEHFHAREKRLHNEKQLVDQQITESDERYKHFLNLSSEGIWRFELERPIPIKFSVKKQISMMYAYAYLAECNDAMAKMYGFAKASDIIGAKLKDFLIESDPQNVAYLTAFIKARYRLNNTESTEKDKNGNVRHFVNNLTGFVEKGLLKRAWGTQLDVTDKRKVEEHIQKSEARFRTIFQNIGVSIWEEDFSAVKGEVDKLKKRGVKDFASYFKANPDFVQEAVKKVKIIDVNDSTLTLFEANNKNELLRSLNKVFLPETIEVFTGELLAIAKKKKIFTAETVVKTLKDKRINVHLTVVFPQSDSLFNSVLVSITNMSERKLLEQQKDETLNLLELVLNNAPVGIFRTDKEGNCVYVNKRWCEFSGMKFKQAMGRGWIDALHPEDKDRVFREWYEAAKRKKEFVSEYRFKTSKGKVTWLYGNAVSIKDGKGDLSGYLGTISDITEKMETEQKLTFQANILENVSDSVITTDLQGTITYWNKGAENIFGYTASEMMGKNLSLIYLEIDESQYAIDLKKILKGKSYEGEWKGRRKDKKTVWVAVKTTVLLDLNNKPIGFIGVASDITERKNVEEALRESEERLRLALNAGNVGVWDWDILNDRIMWSDKIYEIHGVTKEDFRGSMDEFNELIYPEDRELVTKHLELALKEKQRYQLEFRAYGPQKRVIWIATSAQVMYNGRNQPIRMLGATIDITKRKELEKQKDEFIGLASHELKTPVTSVKAFTQVLQRLFARKGDEKSALLLKKMDAQIDKLAVLIGDLLDVTRIQEGKLAFRTEYFDFNELVKEITEEVQRTAEKHVIIIKLSASRSVYGDRDRYGQVITNFLTNAIKYSKPGKEIIVTTQTDSDELTMSVKDFGMGIPKEKQSQLFERFFRVHQEKDTYPGLGLGLYISKEIIVRQGGRIFVNSETRKGSTFSFTVPLNNKRK